MTRATQSFNHCVLNGVRWTDSCRRVNKNTIRMPCGIIKSGQSGVRYGNQPSEKND